MNIQTSRKIIGAILLMVIISSGIFTARGFSLFRRSKQNTEGVVVPIVMYHEVKPYKAGKDVITPYEMEGDLKYLQSNGYTTMNMTDLIAYVHGQIAMPEKTIIYRLTTVI